MIALHIDSDVHPTCCDMEDQINMPPNVVAPQRFPCKRSPNEPRALCGGGQGGMCGVSRGVAAEDACAACGVCVEGGWGAE
jgi:hypothetical protein